MSTMTFKVTRKSGTYVKPGIVPANHSAEAKFGAMDAAIVVFFVACVGGLLLLLTRF